MHGFEGMIAQAEKMTILQAMHFVSAIIAVSAYQFAEMQRRERGQF